MKILFLDIDGVLNTPKYFSQTIDLPQDDIYKYLDKEKIKQLKKITSNPDLKVVLHSTWKSAIDDKMKPIDELGVSLINALKKAGIKLYDKTPTLDGQRCLEINSWLKEHSGISNFVIIDDASIDWGNLTPHLVQTDEWLGLTIENVQQAKQILKQD